MITEDEIASWDYAELWDKFPVPARPSKEELKFLAKELQKLKKPEVLILGSTIEYRSLCKKLGISPYIADFDRSHYDILTSYSKDNYSDEHFMEMDWLRLKDKDRYDVILGHRPFNVIGKNMMVKFFGNMYNALKPGGTFYCKGNVCIKKENLNSIIDKWAYKKHRTYPLFSYIEVPLYFKCSDNHGYVDYPKARSLMKKLYTRNKFSEKDYELIRILISMSSEARFRGNISKKEIKNIIKKIGFDDIWFFFDKEICSNMPILKLSK